jgi:hypothetical protein
MWSTLKHGPETKKINKGSASDRILHITNLHPNKASIYNNCLTQQGVSTAANAINNE